MATPKGAILQSFRSVYVPDASGRPPPSSVNINIITRFDNQLQQHIVLFNDILRVFRNALYIQADGALVSFLTNDNFEELKPLRIPHHPGIQLDVVMEIPPPPTAISAPMGLSPGPSPSLSPSPYSSPSSQADRTSSALSNPSISTLSSSSHFQSPSSGYGSGSGNGKDNANLLVLGMNTVRITRAPEERVPVPSTFNIDAATTTGATAVYYPPPPSNSQRLSFSVIPPTPPALVAPLVTSPPTIYPIPAVTVAHVHTDHNNNSSDRSFAVSGHTRVNNNAAHGHSQRSSTSSNDEQWKAELSRNTVQTAIAGSPSSPIQSTRNPHTTVGQSPRSHPQILPTVIPAVVTTAAATATGPSPRAPKLLNVQPRPQAWFDPKDINQAPQETQDRIQHYKTRVQSRDWHESPLPRLFVVLPKSCLHDDKLTLGWDKFRFFWMCEFVEPAPLRISYPSNNAPQSIAGGTPGVGSGSGLAPHVGHHGGYDLVHPEEFFHKYRAALLLNLQMFKFSAKATSITNGVGGGIKGGREGGGGGTSTYTQGVAFLQMSLNVRREEIELYLDLMISHLEQLSSEVIDKIQDSQKTGSEATGGLEQLPILNDDELTRIQSYLVATTPTDSGIDQLHNQYRYVNSRGHVQWICLNHMEQLRPGFDPGAVRKAINLVGTYSAQDASLNMTNMSDPKTLKIFNETDLLPTNGVAEVAVDISKVDWWQWWSMADMSMRHIFIATFWSGLKKNHLTSLALTGSKDYTDPSAPASVPLFDFLLANQQLQSLRVESAQGLLKHINPAFHTQPLARLRVLDFTVDTDEDVEDIKRALAVLVGNATGLRKLRIVWDELNLGGWSTRVVTFLRMFSFKFREPVEVFIKTGEEEILMTVQDGNFQNVHLKVATMAVAEKHPMMWFKALQTLTIKGQEKLDSVETRTHLTRILGLNPLLTTLHLECWAIDIQIAEEAVKSVVQSCPCGLTKVVLKDSLVAADYATADELSLTIKFTAATPTTKTLPSRSVWSNVDDNSVEVLAEVRAASEKFDHSSYGAPAGVDNSLFYLYYGPQIRNMHLGKYRQRELRQYLEGIQGMVYERIHLTCLAIHGYWPDLPLVLERSSESLKLLAVRMDFSKGENGTGGSEGSSVMQTSLFTSSKVAKFFRGDRLVLVHQTTTVDEEVRKIMASSRCCVVTFASDPEAWDRIVSDLFIANKP